MAGFELYFKGKKHYTEIKSGSMSVISSISSDGNNTDLTLGSLDIDKKKNTENLKYTDWLIDTLSLGDELTIKIKKIDKISEPISIREELIEKEDENSLFEKYSSLKSELEKEGLI